MSRAHRNPSGTVALMPASLLPFKQVWQRLARALPPGTALIVVPEEETPLRRSLRRVARQLRQRGHRDTAVSAAHLMR
ncbi:MAG: hypothetical protein M3Q71_17070 [Chloroflexota bacterium]|nr:hypothetical protein [Chloroflexota bacterium]